MKSCLKDGKMVTEDINSKIWIIIAHLGNRYRCIFFFVSRSDSCHSNIFIKIILIFNIYFMYYIIHAIDYHTLRSHYTLLTFYEKMVNNQ